ncbi:GNAT family N-acetyltransferase [Aquihabitans sp. G128]|uniref:GNAT family N-acetyltransferase n=1 Tax=Aquihabitans sp. G128 TaxID=2849779 RepID=UPI001C238159|nr:GNAT family N-acetyltransferase [Aquihabitans sp. G128]QXC62704.1 GNAT family N-acetyltransferase [Aquihabitans sp. G128]
MPTVRPATPDEIPRVGEALAAAFADDPVWSWLASPRASWSERAAAWFAAEARTQLRGHGEVLVDDELRGAALWSSPGHWQTKPSESVALLLPSLRLFRSRSVRGLRTVSAMEAKHPKARLHWYLAVLGTDPAHQGHGVGSALIRAVTDRCDEQGLPAYLEVVEGAERAVLRSARLRGHRGAGAGRRADHVVDVAGAKGMRDRR